MGAKNELTNIIGGGGKCQGISSLGLIMPLRMVWFQMCPCKHPTI